MSGGAESAGERPAEEDRIRIMRNDNCLVWAIVFATSIAVSGAASAQPTGPGPIGPGPIGPGPVGAGPVGPGPVGPGPLGLGPIGLPPVSGVIGPMSLEMPPMVMAWSDQERQDREKDVEQRQRERETRVYDQGRDDLDESRYDRAIGRFNEVVAMKGPRADAALYYKAFAQNRAGQQAEALATVATLTKEYPKSRYLGFAKGIEAEIRSRNGQPLRPESQSDDELKMYAIAALQNSDPEQAVPQLEKVLQGNAAPRVKSQALFVLAQSNSPRARDLLKRIAMGNSTPELQNRAINYLGTQGGSETRAVLAEVYSGTTDVDVKRRVLRAFMVAGDKDRLLSAAQTEQNPDLRQEAVQQLGVMGAHDALWQLYQKETSVDVKKRIIQAMFVGGDADRLIELTKTEKIPELRLTAIRNLGVMGSKKTSDALVQLYNTEKDPERPLRSRQRGRTRRSRAQGVRSDDEERDRVETVGDGLQGSGGDEVHDGTAGRKVETTHAETVQRHRNRTGDGRRTCDGRRRATAANSERNGLHAAGGLAVRVIFPIARRVAARRRMDRVFGAGLGWRAGDVLFQLGHDRRERKRVERVGLLRLVPPGNFERNEHLESLGGGDGRRGHQARRIRSDDRAVSHRESGGRTDSGVL